MYISQFEEICRFVFSTFGISIDYIKRNEVVRPALDLYARVLRSQHEFAKMSEVICACGSFSATAWRRKLKKGERSVFNRSCTALFCLAADYRRGYWAPSKECLQNPASLQPRKSPPKFVALFVPLTSTGLLIKAYLEPGDAATGEWFYD